MHYISVAQFSLLFDTKTPFLSIGWKEWRKDGDDDDDVTGVNCALYSREVEGFDS